MKDQVVRIANWLRANGVRKGDDVTLYMPMVPELPAAMLACARLGAVHSVVFGGFSADALAARIGDSKSRIVLTASAVRRGAKPIPLKAVVDAAVAKCAKSASEPHRVERVLVLDKPEAAARADVPFDAGRDEWWQDALARQPADDTAPIEWVGAEHPLFKLYTSGSTGKPKGVIHSTAGYMVRTRSFLKLFFSRLRSLSLLLPLPLPSVSFFFFFFFYRRLPPSVFFLRFERRNFSQSSHLTATTNASEQKKHRNHKKKRTTLDSQVGTATTFKHVFDYKPGQDVYWCTADCGWITGHSYVTYGPLLHAATQVRLRRKKRERKRWSWRGSAFSVSFDGRLATFFPLTFLSPKTKKQQQVIFEGVPTFPDAGRMWQIVAKHGVTQLYTAPTAIRALEAMGDDFVTAHDRSSLRVLGSVGEPIGPQAWHWYHGVVGEGRCPIVDTWWQTETGKFFLGREREREREEKKKREKETKEKKTKKRKRKKLISFNLFCFFLKTNKQ